MRFLILGILILLIIGGIVVATREPEPVVSTEDSTSTVGEYFRERMLTRAVADIGQPIEGFDANLLMKAYPGLFITDFSGVETLEGKYEIGPADELLFVRDESKMISTAERTVSEEGYATLLENISRRMEIPLVTIGSVDELIDRIDTGETLMLALGQRDSALGVSVTPQEVLEDSRCPLDVTCIQAGRVRVQALIESGLGSSTQIFEIGQEVTTEAESVRLTQVSPERISTESVSPSNYLFTFEVMKRPVDTIAQ